MTDPIKAKDWRDNAKQWWCVCGIALPYFGTKMVDGNLRCQECKRVYIAIEKLHGQD